MTSGDSRARSRTSLGKLRANDVGSLEALGPLEQIELHRFAFVERAVAVFLDRGEMHEHVFARGALDESVALRSVKPLHSTLLSHKNTPFASNRNVSPVSFVCPSLRNTPSGTERIWCRRCEPARWNQQKRPLAASWHDHLGMQACLGWRARSFRTATKRLWSRWTAGTIFSKCLMHRNVNRKLPAHQPALNRLTSNK